MDDKLITALIAAGTSILTVLLSFLLKPLIEKKSHASKVEVEHEYEQRKKIKEVLSTYKIHLINASQSLSGRLSNLSIYHSNEWLKVNGVFISDRYYFQSTIYRILSFYAWIKIIETNLIYLDTTIATKEDLYFIKYLRAMKRVLQRGTLVKDLQDQPATTNDIIFRDQLDEMCLWMIQERTVISFSEFKEQGETNIRKYAMLCAFIDGISPDENRRRWDRLYALQLLLISFQNVFGYDFQYKGESKIKEQIHRMRKHEIFPNLILHIKKYKLEDEKEAKRLIGILEDYIKSDNEKNKPQHQPIHT